MTERTGETALDIDALLRENERLRSNVKYLETHLRRLEAFFNNAPVLMYIKNGERQYTAFGPVREHQFGLTADEILWHTDLDLCGNWWGALSCEQDAKALAGKVVEALEAAPSAPDDGPNWLVVRFPFVDQDGQRFLGAVGIDISKHLSAGSLSQDAPLKG